MRTGWRPQSLGWKLFLVLALFAAAPTILVVTFSDFALRSTINEEIGKAAMGKLRVSRGIETILGDLVKNTCMRIALDPELQALEKWGSYGAILADGTTQFQFVRYLDRLDDTVRTNPLFHSIDIVFEDADYVLSSETGATRRSLFGDRLWLEALGTSRGFGGVGAFVPPHRVGGTPQGELVVSYYFPFPSYLTEVRGAVAVHLKEREFSLLINNADRSTEGTVSLLDDTGQLVSHPDQSRVGTPWSTPEDRAAVLDLGRSEGVLTDTSGGSRLVTWYRPEPGSWTYVGDFPLEALTRNVAGIRWLTLAVALVFIVLGVAVAYLIAQRFFHPVRRLIRDVSRRLGRKEDWEGNELSLLSGAFDILLKRETQLFRDLESQTGRRNEEWCGRALRGELSPDQTPGPAGLEGRWCLAGAVVIDGFPNFTQSFPPEQREYLRSVVLHMVEQAFLPEIRCLGTPVDPRTTGLVLWTDVEDGGCFADRIDEGFEALASEAARVLGTSITLCLGSRRRTLTDLPASWTEASTLVHQRFLRGPGQWFWEENPAVCSAAPHFPLKTERALVSALEARDSGALARSWADLKQTFSSRCDLSYDNVQLILHQVVGVLVRHLVENSVDLTRLFGTGGDLHRALSDFETLDEALRWLESTFLKVVAGESDPGEPGYVSTMVQFIRANLHRDFGVEAVAEAVGLSYSHARKVFEDALGESIVDHVNALRIEEARGLLDGSQTLEAVAQAVGYNNSQSFHRHFKKRTGVTPGDYRNRNKGVKSAENAYS